MLKNIPNKYICKILLEEITNLFKGKFDFFYLPMDIDNKCNLGYAFINLLDPLHIPLFFDVFQNKRWKKYKSEKQCDLKYARYQGKGELTSHIEKKSGLSHLSVYNSLIISKFII